MCKYISAPIVVSSLLLLFSLSNVHASHKTDTHIQLTATTVTKIYDIHYDNSNHTYYVDSKGSSGLIWTLPVKQTPDVSPVTLGTLKRQYIGRKAYVEYDTNGESSNDEDWTVLNWWTGADVD